MKNIMKDATGDKIRRLANNTEFIRCMIALRRNHPKYIPHGQYDIRKIPIFVQQFDMDAFMEKVPRFYPEPGTYNCPVACPEDDMSQEAQICRILKRRCDWYVKSLFGEEAKWPDVLSQIPGGLRVKVRR